MKSENKKFKVKRIVRNLPETNSSSSHSVVICNNDITLNKNFEGLVDKDGVIRVSGRDFGWEYEKYNDPLTKLQYVCGILSHSGNKKKLKSLIDLVLDFTGAKKVEFDFLKEGCSIDHNSSDIFEEIIESKDSIKNFIFNSNSWLFLGNDNSDSPEDFYNVFNVEDNSKLFATVSLNFGYNLGNVDIEINRKDLSNEFNLFAHLLDDEVLYDITFDVNNNKYNYNRHSTYLNKSDMILIRDYGTLKKITDKLLKPFLVLSSLDVNSRIFKEDFDNVFSSYVASNRIDKVRLIPIDINFI